MGSTYKKDIKKNVLNQSLIKESNQKLSELDFWDDIFQNVQYCRIIIVRGGAMFVAFVGNPCTRIYIPTNVHTSIC